MFHPDDPLAPRSPAFDEPWHAQALALADSMVQAGHFSAPQWSEALGAALREANTDGAPDTDETYYSAVLNAVERLAASHTPLSPQNLSDRKSEWIAAYRRTPHGRPVVLLPQGKLGD